jgi:hypothetical protein
MITKKIQQLNSNLSILFRPVIFFPVCGAVVVRFQAFQSCTKQIKAINFVHIYIWDNLLNFPPVRYQDESWCQLYEPLYYVFPTEDAPSAVIYLVCCRNPGFLLLLIVTLDFWADFLCNTMLQPWCEAAHKRTNKCHGIYRLWKWMLRIVTCWPRSYDRYETFFLC